VFTSPVGSFKANTFGVYDMTGNAWQWCRDQYRDYDKEDATDPMVADTGGLHVLRGGSWGSEPAYCRSASRIKDDYDYRFVDDVGFRVVVLVAGLGLHTTESLAQAKPVDIGGLGTKELK
jgi:formylglycine-generating enzyme required for sulfatase activity